MDCGLGSDLKGPLGGRAPNLSLICYCGAQVIDPAWLLVDFSRRAGLEMAAYTEDIMCLETLADDHELDPGRLIRRTGPSRRCHRQLASKLHGCVKL